MSAAGDRIGHALVVGGTGMLRGVCLDLAQRGWIVSVVARRHVGLASLAAEARAAGGMINPLPADYHDEAMLAARLRSARAGHGPVSLAVCWVHSSASGAVQLIAEMVAHSRGCRLFHIVGSEGHHAPAAGDASTQAAMVEGVSYRRVTLGFVREANQSRWLTHDEISRGVLRAIDRDGDEAVVGTVQPWAARPL